MKINKIREGLQKKLRDIEERKANVEANRDSLMQQISSVEKGNLKAIMSYKCTYHPLFNRTGARTKASGIREKVF